MTLVDPRPIEPVPGPLDAVVALPGSKSITNRALLCAALAEGRSRLGNVGWADDTLAMAGAITYVASDMYGDDADGRYVIEGRGGIVASATVDARQSGTTARFVLPVLALGQGRHRLDGDPQLRRRPMADGIAALRSLGVEVIEAGEQGHLPLTVVGSPPVAGGRVQIAGDASSQFLSGLLMAAPHFTGGLAVDLSGELVSQPYVTMTLHVMRAFGARASADPLRVEPGGYRGTDFDIEPDASTASYFFAAAAVCGGRVTVPGLGATSVQGDVAFVDVLEHMGATVERTASATTVAGTGSLRGGEFDLRACSDLAPTLAAVAVFADTPTRVTGVGFIRGKESDRIAAVVHELQRLGIEAHEEPDGFTVHPGEPAPGVVETYDDHRIAMSFAVIGLRRAGIAIADPGCVAKTFPGFWDTLDQVAGTAS